jgi:HIV Tat-specific factor 1
MVARNPDGKTFNIKMYKDESGNFKGDAVATYIKVESVDLALQILDGGYLKDKQVHVERAKFTLKGEFDPSKKPRMKKRKDKEKQKKQQERLFSWKLDPLRNVKEVKKSDKVVIVANAFSPEDFEGEKVSEILEYSQDFREEAGKCGTVKKLTVHDRHPEGIVQINMSTPEEAQAVIDLFNGRFFGGKQIKAHIWDGVTKYHVEETDEERAKREQKWTESLTQ